jgi:tripartite-type tricarboxylate transporter receptor subunit TctC
MGSVGAIGRRAFSNLKFVLQIYFGRKLMKLPRRKFLHLAAGAAALPAVSHGARAQAYPSRPITFVVSAVAGGPIDAVARIVSEHMRATLGQPILVENISGGATTIGLGQAKRATPDGYTVSVGNWNTHVAGGAILPALSNILTDFDPVALLASNPMIIVSKKTVPANNLRELMDWLKRNQSTVSIGTTGVGTAPHLGGIYLQDLLGARFQFVPYRGLAPAMNDLMAGHIDVMIDQTSNSMPQVRAGNIRAYAVTAKSRISLAPDIPTVDEAGAPGLYLSIWFGLWVPRRTPKNIIARLNAAAVEAIADQTVLSRFGDLSLGVAPLDQRTPEALGALQKADIEKWWPIIKAAGIKAE